MLSLVYFLILHGRKPKSYIMVNNTTFFKACPNYGGSIYIIQQFPSNKYVVNQIIYCIANCVLMFPTALLNGVSILTIVRSSQLKGKVCYFLILAQSGIDLAVGAIAIPFYTLARVSEVMGIENCTLFYSCEKIFQVITGMSFLTLFLLTAERYTAIIHPVAHRVRLTKRKILICICLLTFPVFLFNFAKFPSEFIHSTAAISFIGLILACNTFAYIKIFLAARNAHSGDRIANSSVVTAQASTNFEKKKKTLRNVKLAKSCALVVVLSYVCYIPGIVCYSLYKNDPLNLRVAYSWSMTIVALNSSLNSVVFFWKRPLLRGEAIRMLKNMFLG